MRRLILRPGAIGDCILALPAMQSLVADYTEIWISAPIVPLITFADKVRALSSTKIGLVGIGDYQMPAALKQYVKSFDSVVSWYGAAREEFREALEGLGIPCRFLKALPPDDYAGHASTFFAEQCGAPDLLAELRVERAEEPPEIVIHPFSGSARKNWPLERYRELAASLPLPVSWTAGPEEELAEATRFDDLGKLASWLAGARLYIGNDSGITHLAAALGVPTLALFGPSDPAKWAPRAGHVTVLRCDPMEALAPEAVIRAANRLLT